ncbi:MAG: hypothetical protein KKG00_12760 [Bacteroidetes bacterium]|nr:hypothetical protein [Bacteroidota bacterium]
MTADIDAGYTVYDPQGQEVMYSYVGRDLTNDLTLNEVNKGTYTIKTYPNQSNGKGNYSLQIYGQFADLKRL